MRFPERQRSCGRGNPWGGGERYSPNSFMNVNRQNPPAFHLRYIDGDMVFQE
jgi:hypothetical protein